MRVCFLELIIGAKNITITASIVGGLILQLHTHQLHNFNCRGSNLCSACVSLVFVSLASVCVWCLDAHALAISKMAIQT